MERLFSRHLHEGCCFHKGSSSTAKTEQKYERSRPFELLHLALDLTVSFEEKSVVGSARLDFRRRAPGKHNLELDAHAFALTKVELHVSGKTEELSLDEGFTYDGEVLAIVIDESTERGSVTVHYSARPTVGLYFLEPDAEVPDRPKQIWSQCQDEDGHHFFPCLDKPHVKMTTEIRATVPSGMTVLSNGKCLEKSTPKKGPWTFHYRHDEPHPAYLVTLVVGEFDEWSETAKLASGKVIPLRFLVPKGKLADGKRAFSGTANMLRLLSERFAFDYPWESYAQVVVSDFIFGGMENTTATTMYEHILLDETASIDIESHDLVVHELGHQWFGDLVTCRDWSHAWLNEGFATFCELVEKEARLGTDEYIYAVQNDLDAYLGEASGEYMRPIVSRKYDEPIDLFDRHLYQKGGLVLHMLRRKLGDELFFKGVSNYLHKHQKGIVETNDLVRALEEVSGRSLERFFDEWVYRAGHPEITVKVAREDGALVVEFKQSYQGPDPHHFELDLEVGWTDEEGEKRSRLTLTEAQAALTLPVVGKVESLTIDPDLLVAAPLKVEAPLDLLRKSLKNAKTVQGRVQAAIALGKKHDALSVGALCESLTDEKESWIVRTEAAAALAKTPAPEVLTALTRAALSKEPRVRRAVARTLGEFRGEVTVETLNGLAKKEKSYLVRAEAARSLGKVRVPGATKPLASLLKVPSWADVVASGALEGIATENAEPEAVRDLLIEWSSYGKPLRARRAAISALGRVGEGHKTRLHLIELLRDRDPHLRTQVLGALQSLGDSKARGAIAALLERELDGRVSKKARKVMAALGSERLSGLRETGEQVLLLEKELAALKLRLSKLEGKKPHADGEGGAKPKKDKKSSKARAPQKPAPQAKKKSPKVKPRGPRRRA